MTDVLNVAKREALGSRNSRRLRAAGQVPAVLYGAGKDSVSLAVPTEQIEGAIRQGTKFVNLEGAVSDSALISEVQWDPFGLEVLHIDLARASAGDTAQITVPVVLKGTAPGVRAGGVVAHQLHAIALECPVTAIPENIEVNVNKLELEGVILVAELELPEGSKALVGDDKVVVQCVEAVEELDEEATAADLSAEPEVIGRKAEDEGEEG